MSSEKHPRLSRRTLLTGSSSLLIATAFASTPLLTGCGAATGAKDSSNSSDAPFLPGQGTGRVQISVLWPARVGSAVAATSRYLPIYAESIYAEIYRQDTPQRRYQMLMNRPESDRPQTQSVAFNNLLPVGIYMIAVVARTQANGQGATVAAGVAQVEVTSGAIANAQVVLHSTLKQLQITGAPFVSRIGGTVVAGYTALDPDNKVLLLPPGALTWSVISGGEFGSIALDPANSAGIFTGTGAGTARIRVAELGAGISAEADVLVVNLRALQVKEQPLAIKAGTERQLSAGFIGTDGNPLDVAPGEMNWSLVAGGDAAAASITPQGVLKGLGEGKARVRVVENRFNEAAEADVTIEAYGTGVEVGVS